MRLIHFTCKRFQYFSADNIYIYNLAKAFYAAINKNYLLVFAGENYREKIAVNSVNMRLFAWKDNHFFYFWLPIIVYFFWTPFFIFYKKLSSKDCWFFASDPNMLWILIFWRRIFRFKYKICSDWHMLFNNWKDNYIAANSNKLITTSVKLKKAIISKSGIDDGKIITVYGGIDIGNYQQRDKISARKLLNLPLDKKIIGYVGLFKSLGMEKGIDTMIEALALLDKEYYMAFIGGKDSEIKTYEELAAKKNVLDRCIFAGRKNFDEVARYEQAMDILVIPYPDRPHFRNYGFPMKVYEYMAAGRPIIYSQLELTEEVLSDCGFTFKPDDAYGLAEKIKYVMNADNNEEVGKKTEMAFNKVKQFTWQAKAEKIINFIKRA